MLRRRGMRRKEKERIEWKKSNMKRRVEKKEKGKERIRHEKER